MILDQSHVRFLDPENCHNNSLSGSVCLCPLLRRTQSLERFDDRVEKDLGIADIHMS